MWGWVRPSSLPRRVDVLLFSAAAACILHCYSDHYGEARREGVEPRGFTDGRKVFQEFGVCLRAPPAVVSSPAPADAASPPAGSPDLRHAAAP